MFIAGQKEMHFMDQYTKEKLGLPGVILMENAGARVVDEIISSQPNSSHKILILAGSGNNGGDGFVIARKLIDEGFSPILWVLTSPQKIKGDAKVHFDVLVNRNIPIYYLKESTVVHLQKHIVDADIIVDSILGTGVKGKIREPLLNVISFVNQFHNKKEIIAVDIPSGVDSETGKVEGEAIKATKTITFVLPKKGFFLQDGPKYIGEWKAVDISVPTTIASELNLPILITQSLVREAIPKRPSDGHKGTFGHVLVIGGSKSFVGAPIYTGKAAFETGAGLVTLVIPENIYSMIASQVPEALFLALDEEKGHFASHSIESLFNQLTTYDCITIGPGMSRFTSGEKWVEKLITTLKDQTIVVDADGLYLLRNNLELMKSYQGEIIFTPHPGEMSYLMNKTVKEIEGNRLEIAKLFAEKYNVYLLLKGHRPIIATPKGKLYVNPHGNDSLGKGGSGDVLTGIITSFIAQGASPIEALISASFLHAKAGEEKGKELSNYGVTPMDIIDQVKKEIVLVL